MAPKEELSGKTPTRSSARISKRPRIDYADSNTAADADETIPSRSSSIRTPSASPPYLDNGTPSPPPSTPARPASAKARGKGKAAETPATASALGAPTTSAAPADQIHSVPETLSKFSSAARVPRKNVDNPKASSSAAKSKAESVSNAPDLELHVLMGIYHASRRVQGRSTSSRVVRPHWGHGLFQPPDLALAQSGSVIHDYNEDAQAQPNWTDTRANALAWPRDGLVRTRLSSDAFEHLKVDRFKLWISQAGWIPDHGLYDLGWWPGKPVGYHQSQQRTNWAQQIRGLASVKANGSKNADASASRIGWPYLSASLDIELAAVTSLSTEAARPYLNGTITQYSSPLRHPTTVIKLSLNETRPLFPSSQAGKLAKNAGIATAKKAKGKKQTTGVDADENEGGADDDIGDDLEQDDQEDGGDVDGKSSTVGRGRLESNQVEADLDDPKFAGISNLGMSEADIQTGDELKVLLGPPGSETLQTIRRGAGLRLDSTGLESNDGHILNAGGHVYDVDWAHVPIHLNRGKEYFIVSAAPRTFPRTFIGDKVSGPLPDTLQLWSLSPDSDVTKGKAKLELVICHDLGTAYKLAFCPVGHDYAPSASEKKGETVCGTKPRIARRLGVLAGCFADGSVGIFSIPYPEDIVASINTTDAAEIGVNDGDAMYIRLDPVLRLEMPKAAANCLAWAGGELLAVGSSIGYVAIWDVGSVLRRQQNEVGTGSEASALTSLVPSFYMRLHRAAVTSVTWVLQPSITSDGLMEWDSLPRLLSSTSLDGWVTLTDVMDPQSSSSIERSRSVHYASAFTPWSCSLVNEFSDGSLTMSSLNPEEMFRSRTVSSSPVRILDISTSSFHPSIAAASAHGQVKVSNALRALKRSGKTHTPKVHLAVYQSMIVTDSDPDSSDTQKKRTGTLLLKHQLAPSSASEYEGRKWNINASNPVLAITAVRWNPNFGRAQLLLSASAAGFVKIDRVNLPFSPATL
ncbi:hypothetical protein BCV70DRAFT_117252 [Testicularia cyperi]|uniref:WD40 repeat-like protein n=1 Tax=Testicularia cyperi TaxID=1882483 RepID=A0A317XNC5_9BASI|nr:hypothetical protein BCV70DRAFT_117252 [Testicularia cyperi]